MSNQKEFEDQCFQAHNAYRAAHNVPGLKRNETLSNYAQVWAENMAKKGKLYHSTTEYGENVFWSSSKSGVTGFDVSKSWYDEVQFYDFTKNEGRTGKVTGHFTQVVWKNTTEAGFGIAIGEKGTYAVGSYTEAGNYKNKYGENVFPKISEPKLPQLPSTDKKKDTAGDRLQPTPVANKPTRSGEKESSEMDKPGKTIETIVEVIDEGGNFTKKTTVKTTTITEGSGGGMRKGTQTQTTTQQLGSDYKGKVGILSEDLEKLALDPNEKKKHDGKDTLSSSDVDKFNKEMRSTINDYRKKHGADALKHSQSLQDTAVKHAQKMLKEDNLDKLITDPPLGQCFLMKLPKPSGSDTAKDWYKGKDKYDFKKAEFTTGSGNFTQMVWKDSKEIGVGIASNKEGLTYIIALYKPVGNVSNQFAENVKK